MEYSEDNNNDEILDTYAKEVRTTGTKKYVIAINNEYVPLIDSMSIDKRNELINEIIAYHNDGITQKQQVKQVVKVVTYAIIFLIVLLFTAPVLLGLANISYNLTRNNYNEMQNNFEVLYNNH